ncbi:MAG: hemoglobin, partial [Kribbellaceae bacterium]|nr:hemoglobin [Kribbellaceae bacterium]
MTTPTVYEWAGGAEAFRRLTEVFYDKVLEDPLLAPVFAHMSDQHREHVATWLGEVFGGPKRYTEELGGYPAMLSHHLGLALTEEQRARWAAL